MLSRSSLNEKRLQTLQEPRLVITTSDYRTSLFHFILDKGKFLKYVLTTTDLVVIGPLKQRVIWLSIDHMNCIDIAKAVKNILGALSWHQNVVQAHRLGAEQGAHDAVIS